MLSFLNTLFGLAAQLKATLSLGSEADAGHFVSLPVIPLTSTNSTNVCVPGSVSPREGGPVPLGANQVKTCFFLLSLVPVYVAMGESPYPTKLWCQCVQWE